MIPNRITVTTLFCLFTASMLAAEPKSLILQTQPEPTVIELIGSVEILPSTGNIVAVPADPEACSGTDDEVEVSCDDVEVQTSSFSVTPNPVEQGQDVRFSWASRGAWSCEATGFGDWESDSRLPSGSGVRVSTNNMDVGNYVAQLACYNGPVFGQTRSLSIEIREPDDDDDEEEVTPAQCDGRTLPSTWSRKTTGGNSCSYRFGSFGSGKWGDHDCRHFNKVYPWNWDDQTSLQRVVGMSAANGGRKYIAMEFNSGSITSDMENRLNVNTPQSSGLDNRRKVISISRCPGDFNAQAIEEEMGPGCVAESFTNSFRWGGSDFRASTNRCGLEPHTQYYLNIIHTQDPIGTLPGDIQPHPDCTSGSGCGTRLTPTDL